MFDEKLTKKQENLLRDEVIDQDRPGSILRDVITVLDFVGPEGLKSAGKYNLLPIDTLPELDSRLSRPLRLPLKRPQLRSHPYLQGLHLVLRATGLFQVTGSGSKTRLVVPAEIRERWRQLNPTEQYFALLEGWLLVSRSEMVGERERSFGGGCLFDCLTAWRGLPTEGLKSNSRCPEPLWLPGIYGEQYHLALMDLFGLLRVEQPATPVVPWSPASVKHTPFGDALFTLLIANGAAKWNLLVRDEDESSAFGRWQSIVQPYFPEWRTCWDISSSEEPREGTFLFRVSLGREVWRKIAIDSRDTLDDLISCILRSINFDNDHLYEFSYRDRLGATVRASGPIDDGGLGTDEVEIGDLPLEPGQHMNLLYDFGDSWRFKIKLERIDPPGKRRTKAKVVERHGKAPEQYPDWD